MILENKKASYEYFLNDRYEVGVVLSGTEIKNIRAGKCNFNNAFIKIASDGVFLFGFHISPYDQGNIWNTDPDRPKKLLMHKKEIMKISHSLNEKGYTLIPTKGYFSDNGRFKIEIALAKGKKLYDKRRSETEKTINREIERRTKLCQ